MAGVEERSPVKVGERAPEFSLPAVDRDGTVSLGDYRGRAVMLVINRGLWCTFCRRYLVQLTGARGRLQDAGADLVVVIATPREAAEFYVRQRPIDLTLAADPAMTTHRAYRLPQPPLTPAMEQTWDRMRLGLVQTAFDFEEAGELARAIPSAAGDPGAEVPLNDLRAAQARLYPHDPSDAEKTARDRVGTQSTGQFLIDRDGVVRWCRVQGVTDPPAALGNVPPEQQLVAAVRSLAQ